MAARHRAFMAPRLFGSLIALGILPAFLALRGVPTLLEFVVLAWMIVPLATAYFLSRTGRYESAHVGMEEERCRLLAGNMTDVITRHGHNGRVLFASPNAEAVLGAPAGELMGHGLIDHIHLADRPAYLTALSDAAATGDTRNIEFRLRQTVVAGAAEAVRPVWVEMHCRPFADGATRPAAREVVAVMRDVTRRKAEQEALIDARAEAERANAAKSRFLAVMGHELRTPLNAIIGFSEMLRNESQIRVDSNRRQEYARLINESGYHLLAVVNDILDMSRLETGDFAITAEPFKLAAVMVSCHELLALKAQQADVALTCDVPAGLPDIVADKRAVKQILINLISNAIKFTDRGGTVTVGATIDGQHVLLAVEDTGIGIAADDLARIGAPFFQARGSYARRHDGTGLGLSIVKGLVKLHGGELGIRSRPGEGTRMVVRLPLDCERALEPQRAIALQWRPDPPAETEPQAAAAHKAAQGAAQVETPTRLEAAVQRHA